MTLPSANFYSDLPVHRVTLSELLGGDGATMLVPPTADQRRQLDEHIHFVDAADGGYTMAARMWRKKQR